MSVEDREGIGFPPPGAACSVPLEWVKLPAPPIRAQLDGRHREDGRGVRGEGSEGMSASVRLLASCLLLTRRDFLIDNLPVPVHFIIVHHRAKGF